MLEWSRPTQTPTLACSIQTLLIFVFLPKRPLSRRASGVAVAAADGAGAEDGDVGDLRVVDVEAELRFVRVVDAAGELRRE